MNTTEDEFNLTFASSSYAPVGGLEYIRRQLPLFVPYLVVLSCAAVVGTFGNALLIVAVVCSEQLRHVGNYFVVNLAISDLIISFFVNGLAFVGALSGEAYFVEHPLLCQAAASACLITCYCSLLTLSAISVDRYLFICHRTWHNRIFGKRTTLLACSLIWTTAFCLHLSNFFNWGSFTFDRKALICLMDRRASLSHSIFFSTAGIGLPLVTSTTFYTLVYLHLRAAKAKVLNAMNNATTVAQHSTAQLRGVVMLFFAFIAFFLLWLPFAVLFIADHCDQLPGWMMLFALLIGHCNSAVNPVLYGVSNRSFRKGYTKVLRLGRCLAIRTRPHDAPTTRASTHL